MCAETPRTGEPNVVVSAVLIIALETGGVLSSLVILELNRGRIAETRTLAVSDCTDEGTSLILGLESLKFSWGQAITAQSKEK